MKFTEAKLEETFSEVLALEGYPHSLGETINRAQDEVLIVDDLNLFLQSQYNSENLSKSEIDQIALKLKSLPASDQ